MSRLRIAVATARFRCLLRDVTARAAQTGATGVQFDARHELRPDELSETGRRQLLHSLSERSLSVTSLSFPLRRPLYELDQLDARMAALQQALQFAWNLKARVVTCRLGHIPEEVDAPETLRLRELLADLARAGNHVGVTLSVTTAGEPAARLVTLLEGIDEGPLGVDFDPAACVLAGQNPVSELRELHRVVTHITIRDAVRGSQGRGAKCPSVAARSTGMRWWPCSMR